MVYCLLFIVFCYCAGYGDFGIRYFYAFLLLPADLTPTLSKGEGA
jgi:hypothetical protein